MAVNPYTSTAVAVDSQQEIYHYLTSNAILLAVNPYTLTAVSVDVRQEIYFYLAFNSILLAVNPYISTAVPLDTQQEISHYLSSNAIGSKFICLHRCSCRYTAGTLPLSSFQRHSIGSKSILCAWIKGIGDKNYL